MAIEVLVSGLSNAVLLTAPPNDPVRLLVVQQNGLVRMVRGGVLSPQPFLDLRPLISDVSEQGRGLLSLAFDPRYERTGHVFVSYTDEHGDSRIDRYVVPRNREMADPRTRTPVLRVDQPIGDHNGGHIAFGPDGNLYIGMGDGGSGETRGNGQDTTSLLGALLRLDVRTTPYSIPVTNPFPLPPARSEIWAYGLRNPWRWSFDPETGQLFIPDVGENHWEEVNAVPWRDGGGYNFGWSTMEGTHCFEDTGCSSAGLELPVLEYAHTEGGCGVIGGYVYRGDAIPSLRGTYLYGDFCGSGVRSFRLVNGRVQQPREWALEPDSIIRNIVSFGRDARGEIYVVDVTGTIARIVGTSPQ